MSDKLSERVRSFSWNLSELHGSKKQAKEFYRGWADEVAAFEEQVDEAESERDMLRTVLDDTDKAELLEALEQSTKEALNLKQRVNELETDGCGQCEACENFFPVSLLSITDDDVMLCPGDWDEVLSATADLSKETT